MKQITFEARSLEEAMPVAVEAFRVNPTYITLDTIEKKSMLGLKRSYEVTARLNITPVDLGRQLLKEMLDTMGIHYELIVETQDEEISYSIDTDENPVLIGRNGKTLESIQFYLRTALQPFSEQRLIITVDIGGYRENRRRQLEILATKTAKEVARSRIEAALKPMNAYERRVIHTKLSEWRDVETVSVGEHPNRYLVIRPKS
ncbi:MAG: KH domain-containing protein [Acholeplasmatales bacterium]|nr:MAG: KH domain-containing protein [Acholeplasmatales bacterium]